MSREVLLGAIPAVLLLVLILAAMAFRRRRRDEEPADDLSDTADVIVCMTAEFFAKDGLALARAVGTACPDAFRVWVLVPARAPAARAHKINEIISGVPNYERFLRARFRSSTEPLGDALRRYGAHLYLSARPADVVTALAAGIPSANVYAPESPRRTPTNELRVAFDGDAVLFSDEAEQVYQTSGKAGFLAHEERRATVPLRPGPFQPLLRALMVAQERAPIRTYLVTARGPGPEKIRAINSLAHAGLRLDGHFFRDGQPKGPVLGDLRPHIFFDDNYKHVCGAQAAGILAGQVPYDAWRPARSKDL